MKNSFVWLKRKKKKKKIENIICINLPLCHYQIKQKVIHYIFIKKIYTNGNFIKKKKKNTHTHTHTQEFKNSFFFLNLKNK